ncbi:hypothetical protein STSO111631_07760 [Stackebrandtia soli]
MLAVLGPIAGVALGSAIDDVRDCQESVTLRVAAEPAIAGVLTDHAMDWSAAGVPVDGVCISVDVTAVDSASAAAALADDAGIELDLGDADISDVDPFDVWVPNSLTWLSSFADAPGFFDERIDSVAEADVGIAVPESATVSGVLSELPLALNDPRHDAVSLAVLRGAVGVVPFTPVIDRDGYDVMSLPDVLTYNAGDVEEPLMFIEPAPPVPALDYPMLVLAELPSPSRVAADAFRSSLLSDDFPQRLPEFGFAPAGPYPQLPDAEEIAAAIELWDRR